MSKEEVQNRQLPDNQQTNLPKASALGRFATHHAISITFLSLVLCLGGIYSAFNVPSSVFPQTDFPRVVILVENGVMPADEMMARITRPIEESMKDIPGVETVRSATGRGSAEINVFFSWNVDMVQSELYVLGRLSQIRSTLPDTAETSVNRLTFSAFPIIGVSLTSPTRDMTHLWEIARYNLKPRFLRIPGVARVDIVGGRTTEYHVVVDPAALQAAQLTMSDVKSALEKNNLIAPAGMHEENHTLFLTVLDGRLKTTDDLENFTVKVVNNRPIRIRDFAGVKRGPEPVFTVVTADGVPSVLINIRSQPDGSTLDIASRLKQELRKLKQELPPDMKLKFFYDQSLIVKESVKSVWEALIFGLILSIVVIYLFLHDFGSTFVAVMVIPITVLITLLAMKLYGLSFNLMTLGGVAAAVGLVIDDAIVVVEAIFTKLMTGMGKVAAVQQAIGEIFRPLLASTLTPVVVFIPLTYLDGITGVFFRALAITMVVSLITSLVLAVTFTPSMAAWFMGGQKNKVNQKRLTQGPVIILVIKLYEVVVRRALSHYWITLGIGVLILLAGYQFYLRLSTDFLPSMDEGGFVIDYIAPPGSSLAETDKLMMQGEDILMHNEDIESYSRRTGTSIGLELAEAHTGDFLIKLKQNRKYSTGDVISELRNKFHIAIPSVQWEFPGILGDLIGDLMWAPNPIEIKLFSTDIEFLKKKAPEIEETIKQIPGVVDTFNGLVYTGNSLSFHLRNVDAERFGLTADDVAKELEAAMLGQESSSIIEGDRVINIRVKADPLQIKTAVNLQNLPIRTAAGQVIKLSQVADIAEEPGQLELRREDMRQDVAVTARLENRDMGSAMSEILDKLNKDTSIPPGTIEIGGLYLQQQKSFKNLFIVLIMAIVFVFTVLLIEFRSFYEPIAIVFGAILALFGTIMGLYLTNTSLNVVSFLGAIIGVGIVAKNGILMLDFVEHLLQSGLSLKESLVQSGRRRLRPVLMTSFATLLAMLPLAYGIGSGADMLRPLAIAIMGALCISVLLSLIATPTLFFVMVTLHRFMINRNQNPDQSD